MIAGVRGRWQGHQVGVALSWVGASKLARVHALRVCVCVCVCLLGQ